eukprot:SAG11_NODE_54_length_19571_cov_29.437786_23_plen_96_part_00
MSSALHMPDLSRVLNVVALMQTAGSTWSSNRRAYCVHKIYMSHGHRASLFLRDEMTQPMNAAERLTTLEVPTTCVGCMELLLDYVYEDQIALSAA